MRFTPAGCGCGQMVSHLAKTGDGWEALCANCLTFSRNVAREGGEEPICLELGLAANEALEATKQLILVFAEEFARIDNLRVAFL